MFRKIILLIILLSSFHSYAASLTCIGTVEQLAYHGQGRFMMKLSSMNTPVFFCSSDQEWTVNGTGYKTSVSACKMMYSTFLAAKATKEPMDYVHFDGDDVPSDCNSFKSWANVSIRYFNFKS